MRSSLAVSSCPLSASSTGAPRVRGAESPRRARRPLDQPEAARPPGTASRPARTCQMAGSSFTLPLPTELSYTTKTLDHRAAGTRLALAFLPWQRVSKMAAACSMEGCGEEVIARGLCCRHYHRLRRYGNPLKIFRRPRGMTLEEAVEYELGRAVRDGGCLLTQGSRYPSGYGRVITGRRHHSLSRLVLERKLGRKLRRDEVTRHLCHNPPCIEPRHLVPISRADNAKDTINAVYQSLLKCVWVAAAPVLCLHSRGTASRSTRRASGSHRRDARSPAACC